MHQNIPESQTLYEVAVAHGCSPAWQRGIIGWAWHCSCKDQMHWADSQNSIITIRSARRSLRDYLEERPTRDAANKLVIRDREPEHLVFWEIVCVVSWFLLDGFWLMGWYIPMHIATAITLFSVLMIFLHIEDGTLSQLVAVADTFWLFMGILWANGEIYDIPRFIGLAKLSFFLGVVTIIIAMLGHDDVRIVLRRIKIIRFFSGR